MQPETRNNPRWASLGWTLSLVPFLLLPYRWLWLPCGLAAALVVRPGSATLRTTFSRHGTLIVGSLLVLIVRTVLDVSWWLPWLGLFAAIAALRASSRWSHRMGYLLTPLIKLAAFALLNRPDAWPLLASADSIGSRGLTIVCAGDSLTSGVKPGTDEGTYVASLRRRLGGNIINAGVANDRAADLLARLGRTVLSHKPDVVLLFIGGNDYLDGTPRAQFTRTLDQIAARIAASGANLVIVEVPSGIIWNPCAGIYRQIAARNRAILVPETRLRSWYSVELLFRSHLADPLTIDGIHLSPAGAMKVADWLEPYIIRAIGERRAAAAAM